MNLTKLKVAALLVFFLSLVAVIFWQQQRCNRLAAETSSLRQQTAQLDALQKDRELLTKSEPRADQPLAQDNSRELLRLRGEVAMLRRQTNELAMLREEFQRVRTATAGRTAQAVEIPLSGIQTNLRKEDWAFAGYATPENALLTGMWALREGDIQKILASLTPKARQALVGRTETEIVSDMPFDISKAEGYRIIKKEVRSDAEIHLVIGLYQPSRTLADGSTQERSTGLGFTATRMGDEWRIQEE